MFHIQDEPESPNEGVRLRYRMNRNRQMRGACCRDMMIPPNKGACFMYIMYMFKAHDNVHNVHDWLKSRLEWVGENISAPSA